MKPYKRSSGADTPYYVQFTVAGIKYQYNTNCIDRDAAMAAGLAEKARIKAGATEATIGQVLDVYEANSGHLKDRTRNGARNTLLSFLKFSGLSLESPVSSLNRQLVANYQRTMKGHELTANTVILYVRSVFGRRILPLCEHLKLPDISGFLRYPLMRVAKRQYMPPPRETVERMLEEARKFKETDKPAYAAFLLEFYLGLRAGDAFRAEWSWVCQAPGKDGKHQWCLHVPAQSTKNNRDRFVPISERVYQKLTALRQPSAPGMPDYIVWGENYRQRKNTIYYRLSAFIKGHLGRKQTNHELRKYCGATFATEQGLYAAQIVLGHSTPVLTSQTYAALINLPKAIEPSEQQRTG